MRRGIFITFEGVDGAGKTTQAKRLVQALVAAGWPAVYVREPGGCRLGEELRGILLRKEPPNPCRRAELLPAWQEEAAGYSEKRRVGNG